MILVFALAGTFMGTLAAITALVAGQSWWMGLLSYIGAGMLTVGILSLFTVFVLKNTARKTGAARLHAHMPLAEH